MYEKNALVDAITSNKFDEARQLVSKGEKIPAELAGYELRGIYDSLIRGQAFDLIKTLLDNGVIETDIYELDNLDGSFFECLFKNLGDSDVALYFLRDLLSKLDNKFDAVQDQTLLWIAFKNSAPLAVIKTLVDDGFDVNYKTNYEENYLIKIIQEYSIKELIGAQYIQYLIQEGVDPNAGNIVRKTPLALALSKNTESYVDTLLQNGADPNQAGERGCTAYYNALVDYMANIDTYNKLKEFVPADFDIRNANDETLLLGFVRMRTSTNIAELQLLKALIADSADIYQASPYYNRQKTAIDWIAEKPAEILEAVFETGVVDLEHKDDKGNTLLHKVCAIDVNYEQETAKQIYRKVKFLIEQGADVNATNDLDQTPMALAAGDNLKIKTVELLLKNAN